MMQAVHRMISSSHLAGEKRLPSAAEIGNTLPMPTSAGQQTPRSWQIYIDRYASFLITQSRNAQQSEDQASDWHLAARDIWEMWGIPSAVGNSINKAFEAKEFRCFVGGLAGALGTTAQRR